MNLKILLVVLVAAISTGCSTVSDDTVTERGPFKGEKIDYIYWEKQVDARGSDETIQAFEKLVMTLDSSTQQSVRESFERFCRFQGCLDSYRNQLK